MKNRLYDFLRRIPWASRELLGEYFGFSGVEKDLLRYQGKITSVRRADGRTYYSLTPANYRLLPGIPRREMVRKYMAGRYGYSVFDSAESPCFNADFRTYLENSGIWIRAWGDMGHISPDSLLMFINPPSFAENIRDIVLTCQMPERVSFLRVQAELRWKGAQKDSVEIIGTDGKSMKSVRPEFDLKRNMPGYDPHSENYPGISADLLPPHNDTRSRKISVQELRSSMLCRLSSELTRQDYDILRFTACNPFLTPPEIGLLFGGNSCCAEDYFKCEEEYLGIMGVIGKIETLEKKELLKIILRGPMGGTCIPTWQGIDLLAAYHGTIPFYLKKYSQWPQQSFEKNDFEEFRSYLDEAYGFFDSHCFYKQRWGVIRPDHQILCRKFGAALVCGARSLKSEFGFDIEVSGLTTVSSNLKISSMRHGRKIERHLHPDESCTVSCTTGGQVKKWKVFIEIERNTNKISDLLEKLEKYRVFLPAARQFYEGCDDTVLMFLFDDTDQNFSEIEEKKRFLLETMKKYGIRGCVGLLSDAVREPAGWVPKHDRIERETCGNMYLYQKMWQVSDRWPDPVKLPFPGFLI